MAGVLFILAMLDSADAHAHFSHCCLLAARNNFSIYATLPWDTCAVGTNVSGLGNPINPSVNATMGWCEQTCPGYAPSGTSEWLHPITNWFIPYIGLLLLCPTGEREQAITSRWRARINSRRNRWNKKWAKISTSWIPLIESLVPAKAFKAVDYVIGYAEFLGDPASAIWGAFSELAEDWWLSRLALRKTGLRRELLVTAILAGQTEFNETTREGLTQALGQKLGVDGFGRSVGPEKRVSRDRKSGETLSDGDAFPNLSPSGLKSMGTTEIEMMIPATLTPIELRAKFQKALDEEDENWKGISSSWLRDGICILLDARVDFVSTILIPVILMLVVTAGVFYDAYQSLGDNDTAHSLAYGLLYSWLIILSVASNCYTSSLTPKLLEDTIGKDLWALSTTTVRLRDRYTNSLQWRRWMADVAVTEPVQGKNRVVFRFLAGQLFGWACVVIAALCAATISYTTPSVGIGCRSFNHLLYALVSLVVCLIPVLKYSNEVRGRKKYQTILTFTYNFLVICNIIILLLGTAFYLFGVFRSCWCMNLFVPKSRLIELNGNTAEAVKNANLYWLPVGYVAFVFVWIVCATAIFEREYINLQVGVLRKRDFDSATIRDNPRPYV
jgi:hypothetical protein